MGLFPMLFSAAVIGAVIDDHRKIRIAASPFYESIEASARRHGISPSVLAGVLWVESRFRADAVGTSGEVGMAQFKDIALTDVKEAGLVPSVWTLNDLYDPIKAIEAAAALLHLNKSRSGDIYTSIRAYNVGIGRAHDDATAGLDYLLGVLKVAAVDYAYSIFDGNNEQ